MPIRFTFIVLFALTCTGARAEHTAFKLYADVYETEDQVQQVLKAPELAVVQTSASTVPCDENALFGVLYILQKSDKKRLKLTERWHHPHVSIRGERYTDRKVDLRFGQSLSAPMFSGYELLPPLRIDGQFRFELLEDDTPILSHTFNVDCPNSNPGDELICKEDNSIGTRIKELVCKTSEELRRDNDRARRDIRVSDGR